MDNQHKLIKGYGDLSQEEIGRINRLKALGNQLQSVIDEQLNVETDPEARRSVSLGKTHLQTGMMWLIRGIAKPVGF